MFLITFISAVVCFVFAKELVSIMGMNDPEYLIYMPYFAFAREHFFIGKSARV